MKIEKVERLKEKRIKKMIVKRGVRNGRKIKKGNKRRVKGTKRTQTIRFFTIQDLQLFYAPFGT